MGTASCPHCSPLGMVVPGLGKLSLRSSRAQRPGHFPGTPHSPPAPPRVLFRVLPSQFCLRFLMPVLSPPLNTGPPVSHGAWHRAGTASRNKAGWEAWRSGVPASCVRCVVCYQVCSASCRTWRQVCQLSLGSSHGVPKEQAVAAEGKLVDASG